MRAVYLPDDWKSPVLIKDEGFHHLVNVLRLKVGESVLLLDGRGRSAVAKLTEVAKRHAQLEVGETTDANSSAPLDLAIAIPKKDALEAMLKMAVELGARKVWLWRGEFSQERLPEPHRIEALLVSALEQSNNRWLPDVKLVESYQQIPVGDYQHQLLFDLSGDESLSWRASVSDSILTLIGPEAGFSENEKAAWASAQHVKLTTPIMRAPTALACAWGWVLARRVP